MMKTMNDDDQQPGSGVSRLIDDFVQPLARIVMRLGSSAYEFADVARWSFVRCFYETPEFWRNEYPTVQQGSLKTGLSRIEVDRLNRVNDPERALKEYRQNRASRVLSGWVNDSIFHIDGRATRLPVRATKGPSFNRLVRKYGGDSDTNAVIDDLRKAGCVRTENFEVVLVNQTYGLGVLDEERLHWAGYMGKRYIETADFNLTHPESERMLQRVWRQLLMPADKVPAALQIVREEGIETGRRIDARLAKLADQERRKDVEYKEVGVVIFAYEHGDDQIEK